MKWLTASIDPAGVAALSEALGIAAPAARALWVRGLRDAESARRFLRPTLEDLHDPYLLASMPEAVARLRRAIEQKEPILLYGDYDVDGTSAVVILKKGIELRADRRPFTCRTGCATATACAAKWWRRQPRPTACH